MSDSEENRSRSSSALLNIASAYSDSESGEENEDVAAAPQESLGSLVENLRAEAKRAENQGNIRRNAAAMDNSGDSQEASSMSEIVRLDHENTVDISPLPTSKSETAEGARGEMILEEFAETPTRPEVAPVNIKQSDDGNDADEKGTTPMVVPNQNGCATGIEIDDPSLGELKASESPTPKSGVEIPTSICNEAEAEARDPRCSELARSEPLSMETKLRISDVEVSEEGGMVSEIKVNVKQTAEITREGTVLHLNASGSMVRVSEDEGPREYSPKEQTSRTRSSEAGRGTYNEAVDVLCHSPPAAISESYSKASSPEIIICEESSTPESTILNDYLKSKEKEDRGGSEEVRESLQRYEPEEETRSSTESPEIIWLSGADEQPCGNDATTSTVNANSTSSKNSQVSCEAVLEPPGSLVEVDQNKTPSPAAVSEKMTKRAVAGESTMPSGVLQMGQKGQLGGVKQASSSLEVKKLSGTGPVKLKRNFSCVRNSVTSEQNVEKKFCPEPTLGESLSCPTFSSNAEASTKWMAREVSASSSKTETLSISVRESSEDGPREQEQTRPLLSPASSQTRARQVAFSNATTKTHTGQGVTVHSPPKSQAGAQRGSRREEPKRTLPLILRKADVSGLRSKETARLEDPHSKVSHEKEQTQSSTFTKLTDEGTASAVGEAVLPDSQERSEGSVSFNNASSNQENANFGVHADFDGVIGASFGVSGNSSSLSVPEDSGCDNAELALANEEEQKNAASFLPQPVPPTEIPTIIIPKKRGRPRKIPLSETGPLAGTWPIVEKEGITPCRSSTRKKCPKRFKGESEAPDEDETPRKRYIPRYKKKPKSVSEEPEVTRNFNKKGRMEVLTEACKPVTVNQITEYFWPPLSSLPPGEKPDGLMIQEQISEYLGVKSFKRKYPSIKRRPVDMEERNYLQENGYVSENMCDMGLTAVFSSDIMEIMYNDFPSKFEEYRRYSREKKMKEQKALREKQAAENMDPRKEALESIVSWNTDFNKTRRFKVLHLDERARMETQGMPVAPFERILIVHAPVNVPLCVESSIWQNSLFSPECEISARSTFSIKKEYDAVNKWILVVGTVE